MSRWHFIILLGMMALGCAHEPASPPQAEQKQETPTDYVTESEVESDAVGEAFGSYRKVNEGHLFYDRIVNVVEGVEVVIIDSTEKKCLNPVVAKDFDKNGFEDLLVENVLGCGGNCCGNAYFFISQVKKGEFQVTNEEGWVWGDPVVEEWQGKWSLVIASNNMGWNTEPYEEKIERFVLEGAEMRRVQVLERQELEPIVQLRSDEFGSGEEFKSLSFDLDEDGKMDELSTQFWERWGQLLVTLNMGDGRTVELGSVGRRVGIMEETTNSMHNLIGDLDNVLVWDGEAYQQKENPKPSERLKNASD